LPEGLQARRKVNANMAAIVFEIFMLFSFE